MPTGKLAQNSFVMKIFSMKTGQFTLRSPSVFTIACATALATASLNAANAQAQTQTQTREAELPLVVVTANRMEQALQTASIGATVLLGDEIRESGVLDANEAVRKLGGVAARTDLNGGREFGLDLRGYGEAASQNLVVVVDGIRITQIDLASARLSSIAPEMIEKIEIIRGGASVMWGEGAAGGVISVTTKNGTAKGLSGSVSYAAESFAGRDAQARVDVVGDVASFNVNARHYRTDGYRDNSANEQTTYSLGGALNLGAFKARLGYSNDAQDSRFPGALTLAQFAVNPRQTQKPNEFGLVKESRANANLAYKIGNIQAFLDVGQRSRSTDSDFSGYVIKAKSDSVQVSPRLVYEAEIANAVLTSIIGYDYNTAKASSLASWSDELARQNSKAWFGNVSALLASDTRLSAGARAEKFKKSAIDPFNMTQYAFNDQLSAWDLGLNQTMFKGLDVYARAAKSYRLPNIDENRQVTGQLRPTLSRDLEIGAKYQKQTLSAAVRVFKQTSVDEIAFDSNIPPYGANVNQDAIKRTGVELEGRYKWASGFDMGATLQHISATFSNGANVGKRVPLVSDLTLTTHVGYAMSVRSRVEISAQHRSGALAGGDTANACADTVPSATYYNARYIFKSAGNGNGKGWTLAAEVNNLTNKQSYSYAFTYACSPATVYSDTGRAFSLRAKYAF